MHASRLLPFGLTAMAGPALACMPGGLTPGAAVRDEACMMRQNVDSVMAITLGRAEDAGGGIVLQRADESNGCGADIYLVVMDCAADTATIVGVEEAHVMVDPVDLKNFGATDRAEAWVRSSARKRIGMTPAQIKAAARKLGLDFALDAAASGKIRLAGKPVSLACGCELYYPGSAGAGG